MSRSAWIGIGVFAACLLPAWAVKSASQHSRVWWIIAVFFLTLVTITFTLIQRTPGLPQRRAPIPHLLQKSYVGLVVGLSFLLAELGAIMFTYAESGVGFFGRLGFLVSQGGSMFFPVVSRYATELGSTLSPQALFKAQAIVSVFLFAGTISTAIIMIALFRMRWVDRRVMYDTNYIYSPSNTRMIFVIIFSSIIFVSSFFGLGEFGAPTMKFCLIQTNCFAHGDDLTILAASIIKSATTFGFLLGALILFDMIKILPASR